MAHQPDRLSLLRSKYRELITTKKRELVELETKFQLLDELESESNALKGNTPGLSHGRYAKAGLTQALFYAVTELGRCTIAQAKRHLLENGYVPKGKNFAISVALTLKRLHDQGKLKTDLQDGKRVYWYEKPGGLHGFIADVRLSSKNPL